MQTNPSPLDKRPVTLRVVRALGDTSNRLTVVALATLPNGRLAPVQSITLAVVPDEIRRHTPLSFRNDNS